MNLLATRWIAPVLVSASLFLAGCGALSEGGSVEDGRVTAAFYPLAYAAERVAGDHFEVTNLVQSGVEPHDLELNVRQTGDIARSALVVFQSGFQPAVDEAVEQNAEGNTLDAARAVELHEIAAGVTEDESGHGAEEEGDHETGHESGHEGEGHEGETEAEHESHAETGGEESHDSHDHGDLDPHFWLDPLLMADFADAIAAELGSLDPDHEADFTANAAAFREELEALDQAYAEGLASCERDTVVVNHEAFGYLTRYGLHFEAITGLSPGAEPVPAERARLERLIREEGITTVFSEALGSKKAAHSLASDLDVRAAVLDPLEGLSDQTEEENYLSLMEQNLAELKKANGC